MELPRKYCVTFIDGKMTEIFTRTEQDSFTMNWILENYRKQFPEARSVFIGLVENRICEPFFGYVR